MTRASIILRKKMDCRVKPGNDEGKALQASRQVRRREFIALLGASGMALSAWPLAARAQRPALPVIGFLRSTTATGSEYLVDAFRQGLKEAGFVEGQNVAVEYRWADNQLGRLPKMAADLVRRQVKVIVCNHPAANAARVATATIPIVFVTGEDPVKRGLVASLNRPGGNLTGVKFFSGSQLGAKRLELLVELAPKTAVIAVLVDPNYVGHAAELAEVEAAGRTLGRRLVVVKAATDGEFAAAFARMVQAGAGALLVGAGPLFTSQRRALVALAVRHAILAMYSQREHVEAGGLISYSASTSGACRQAGLYTGKILDGAKPSELPVLQPTTFELVINLKTAKALGLTVPPTLLARADAVIE
jgi:putative ABC transport system substrate-binding protein